MQAISIHNLKKHFKVYKKQPGILGSFRSLFFRPAHVVKAVDDISFEIDQGELVGFIGPNGAGKTTTLKCLSGLLYPSKGAIRVVGYTPFERKTEYLKKISLVMGQKNQLLWDLPSQETFTLNKVMYEIDDSIYEKTLKELTTILEVEHLLTTPVRQLSLGQRMKMELIAALLHRPKVLFLDEPTIGLDVVMQKKIRDFISEYNRKFQATILLTSHYMSDVKELCKRVIVIDHGNIFYDGTINKLVEKFADFKILTALFGTNKIDMRKLARLGEIKPASSADGKEEGKVTIVVKRSEAKKVAIKLLNTFPVEDLNIEEPELEEVIRLVFARKK